MNSNQKSVEPHFNETRPETSNQWLLTVRRKLGLMGQVAQILCYIGILGITLGFAIVIVGTFGSTGNLAPTGWLVATLGQMLLLLGVVTTVSVGMEQSASEMRGIVDDRMAEISAQIQQLKENQQRADTGRPAATGFPHTTSQSVRLDDATV